MIHWLWYVWQPLNFGPNISAAILCAIPAVLGVNEAVKRLKIWHLDRLGEHHDALKSHIEHRLAEHHEAMKAHIAGLAPPPAPRTAKIPPTARPARGRNET